MGHYVCHELVLHTGWINPLGDPLTARRNPSPVCIWWAIPDLVHYELGSRKSDTQEKPFLSRLEIDQNTQPLT